MRKIKIVADSSCDLLQLQGADFAVAPMKVITAEREFVDGEQLDVAEMVQFMDTYKGKSKSSCPNTADWLAAFGDADDIFCVTAQLHVTSTQRTPTQQRLRRGSC